MSEISLVLVLHYKTSKFFNDMTKVRKKSEKITAFGGIFFALDKLYLNEPLSLCKLKEEHYQQTIEKITKALSEIAEKSKQEE